MKIRNGFVSNSSSSSFIVGAKKGKITKEKILSSFKTSKDSVLYFTIEDMTKYILNCQRYTLEEYLEENNFKITDIDEDYKNIFSKCSDVIIDWVSDDSGEITEYLLCTLSINYEDDDIIFLKDGGY